MSWKYIGFSSRFSDIKIKEHSLPDKLGANQVLIDVSYIGLNPLDIKIKSVAFLPMSYQVGKDFSGTVAGVGSELASQWKIGDRICGAVLSPFQGTLGTKVVLDASKHALIKPPSNISDEQAAAFPVTFGTASEMLSRTSKRGQLLVLGGATNVGAYVIQLAKKRFDFENVVATCSAKSEDYVKSMGADKTIDYTSGNVSEKLKSLGIKFDAILDTVGGYDALRVWPDILKSYNDGGVYVSIAGDVPPSGSYKHALIRPTLMTIPWAIPRLVFGRFMGINYQLAAVGPGQWTKDATEFFSLPDVKTPVDSVYAFNDYKKAWDRLESMQARGKVLISTKE